MWKYHFEVWYEKCWLVSWTWEVWYEMCEFEIPFVCVICGIGEAKAEHGYSVIPKSVMCGRFLVVENMMFVT